MLNVKTWGWIKLIASVIAFWWAFGVIRVTGEWMGLAGAVALLAGVKIIGGLITVTGTKLK